MIMWFAWLPNAGPSRIALPDRYEPGSRHNTSTRNPRNRTFGVRKTQAICSEQKETCGAEGRGD